MKIAWRKVAVAGLAGFLGGQVFAKLRHHPDIVLPILQASAASGVVGGLLGWGVSVYRRVPPHAFSLSLAANFAVVSGSFLCIRKVVHSVLIEKDARSLPFSSTNRQLLASVASYTSSVASGGLTGALTSLISRYGLRSILMTSLGGMGTGLCAQAGYDKLLEWRKRKAMQIYHEDITGKKSRPFEEWTLENFEARFLGFWHKRAESVGVETELLSLETAVAEERKKIERLNQLLLECGVSPHEMQELDSCGDSSEGGRGNSNDGASASSSTAESVAPL